jgi:hypothetical protein
MRQSGTTAFTLFRNFQQNNQRMIGQQTLQRALERIKTWLGMHTASQNVSRFQN